MKFSPRLVKLSGRQAFNLIVVFFLLIGPICAGEVAAAAEIAGGSSPGIVEAGDYEDGEKSSDRPNGVDGEKSPGAEDEWLDDEDYTAVLVYDPLEPINRVFFYFNDKLYFWLLRPVGRGYGFVVPKPTRNCVANFFSNLKTPIRLVSNLLQGKLTGTGAEIARFVVNSTIGVAGFWDPARNWLEISASEEDFGQTLGKFGLGEGFYICWPLLGPSNVRDSFGYAGDYFLDPLSYLTFNGEYHEAWAARGGEKINGVSLRLGDYEDFKKATFDPYSALRHAYSQRRRSKINDEAGN